jgi:serine/threonine protein kinase
MIGCNTVASSDGGCRNRPRLEGYIFHRVIGEGTFSKVWLATEQLTSKPVAIKQSTQVSISGNLLGEHNIWSQLNHPNIIKLHNDVDADGERYLVCDLADSDLFTKLDGHQEGLPLPEAMKLFTQLVAAIQYLHDRHIAHCDLKLENILLDQHSQMVKVGDFGFARRWNPRDGPCDKWLGSIEYAAPEVLRNLPYDPLKSDVWSLGVILFALLTGYLPFSRVGDDLLTTKEAEKAIKHRILHETCHPVPSKIPLKINNILSGLLCYRVKDRWDIDTVLRECCLVQKGE